MAATKRDFVINYGLQTDNTGTSTGQTLFVDQINDRVGVGTDTPSEKFTVWGGDLLISGSSSATLTVGSGSYSGPHNVNVVGGGSNINNGYALNGSLRLYNNTTSSGNTNIAPASGADINFLNGAGGGILVQIKNSGNFGIGISDPSAKLEVLGDTGIYVKTTTNAATDGAQIRFSDNAGVGYTQYGWIRYKHADGAIYPSSNDGFEIGGTETNTFVKIDGHLVVTENTVLEGQLHGPSNFIIDPSTVGDDTGTVEIKGNLIVQGTTTTINSTTVDLDHLSLGDNEVANFGDSNDLQIYHDGGSNRTIIDDSSGGLKIQSDGNISFTKGVSENLAIFAIDGAVSLYYDNVQKFQTTSGGVRIGSSTAPIDINAYETLNNGTLSFEGSAGQLFSITNNLTSGSIFSVNDVSGIPSIDVDANGTVSIAPYGGNFGVGTLLPTATLHVQGTSLVTGNATFQGNVDLGDADRLRFGDSQDLQIFHGGSNSFIQDTGAGNLFIGADNDVQITNSSTALKKAVFTTGGSVELYYDNSKKFETTNYGIYVTGVDANTSTIAGAANLVLDPSTVGDNTGTVIILGDLQVDGTTTTINSTTLTVDDKNIVLASGAADASAADGAGVTVDGASATLTYASTGDKWVFNKAPYYNTNRLLTTADEGTGNGLDADLLDGQEGTYYLNTSNTAQTKTGYLELSSTSGDLLTLTSSSDTGRSTIKLNTNGNDWELGARGSNDGTNPNTFYIYDVLTTAFRMLINDSGNVYFGVNNTSTSSQKLNVTGGAYVSGNVGIGNTNPQNKLEVNGFITESTDSGTTYWNVVTQQDIGSDPNQIPLNQYLGQLAFLDEVPDILPSSSAPQNNYDINFEYVSDTSIKIRMRGSDGVVRSVTLTLS